MLRPSTLSWVVSRAVRKTIGHLLALVAQAPADLVAVEVGQHHVEHDEVGPEGAHLLERLRSRGGHADLIALEGQRGREQLGDVRLVVDDQDARRRRLDRHVNAPSACTVMSSGRDPRRRDRCGARSRAGAARPPRSRRSPPPWPPTLGPRPGLPSACRPTRRAPRSRPPQAPPGHQRQRLDHDDRRHLGLAGLPVDEADRHLGDGRAVLLGPVGHLDLEAVALGPDPVEVEPAQDAGRVRPVPRRRVGHAETEHRRGVEVAAAREQVAVPGPVGDGAALDVARADGRRRSPPRAAPPATAARPGRARSRRRSRRRRRSRARGPRRSRPGTRSPARTWPCGTAGARRAARPRPLARARPCRRGCRRRPPARRHRAGTRGSGRSIRSMFSDSL